MGEEFKESEEYQKLKQQETDRHTLKNLFAGKVFYLNREAPIYSLEWLIPAFGGKISLNEEDEKITHHVIDRPLKDKSAKREYVVPQWVYDCVNHAILIPAS